MCNTSSTNNIRRLKSSIHMGLQQHVRTIKSDGYLLQNMSFILAAQTSAFYSKLTNNPPGDLTPCNVAMRIAHDLRAVKAMLMHHPTRSARPPTHPAFPGSRPDKMMDDVVHSWFV
jgi:hypothetical protein